MSGPRLSQHACFFPPVIEAGLDRPDKGSPRLFSGVVSEGVDRMPAVGELLAERLRAGRLLGERLEAVKEREQARGPGELRQERNDHLHRQVRIEPLLYPGPQAVDSQEGLEGIGVVFQALDLLRRASVGLSLCCLSAGQTARLIQGRIESQRGHLLERQRFAFQERLGGPIGKIPEGFSS